MPLSVQSTCVDAPKPFSEITQDKQKPRTLHAQHHIKI